MYRVTFLKTKAGDLHDQDIYRLNAGSTDSDLSSPDNLATDSPPPLAVCQKNPASIAMKNMMSLSSTDSEPTEESETSLRMAAEIKRISPESRKILCQTFRPMEVRPIRCGLSVMIGLFSEFPNYKNIWPQFQSIPDSSLMNAPELTKHAATYMRGLRTIIENLDDEERMAKALRRIAYAHVKWNIYKKHIIHMLDPVLGQVRAHNGMTPEIREAWTTLFDVIANLIDIFRSQEAVNFRQSVAKKDRAGITTSHQV